MILARTIMFGVGRWLITNAIGRALIAVTAVLTGLWAFGAHQQHKGAAKAVAKMEKATNEAVSKGRRAADRSGSGGMSNIPVDPGYRREAP